MTARESGASPMTADASARPDATWTVMKLIRWSGDYLKGKGVPEGRLDAEHLLAEVLGVSRLALYLQHDRPLTADELGSFKPLLLRRAAREPLQYVLGHTAFRELDLLTDRRVLIPRPETEELVALVLDRVGGGTGKSALEVGTGSGCIALSLLREGAFSRVVATDASAEALEVAAHNARAASLDTSLELREGSLYEPVAGERYDVIVSNPPYIGADEAEGLEPEVRDWEPHAALFSDMGGTGVLRGLVAGAAEHLSTTGVLALEVGSGQCVMVSDLVRATGAFEEPETVKDLSGRSRFVIAGLARR